MKDLSDLILYKASAGSGKTYTLAKEYLKIVLLNPYDYNKILAVTFTKKATAEMKTRIIEYLSLLEKKEENVATLRKSIIEEIKQTKGIDISDDFEKNVRIALQLILHDYSNFNISTIDSFFQSIVRSFAKELDLPIGMEVELDTDMVIMQAVQAMLKEYKTDKDTFSKWLEDYVFDLIEEDKSWKIEKNISKLAKQLLNEDYQLLAIESEQRFDIETYKTALDTLKQVVYSYRKTLDVLTEQFVQKIAQENIDLLVFKGKSTISSFVKKTKNYEPEFTATLQKMIETDEILSKENTKDAAVKSETEKAWYKTVKPYLVNVLKHQQEHEKKYNAAEIVLKNIYSLALLEFINSKIKEYKSEKNLILISDTNQIVSLIAQHEEVPFIFEKSASFLKYILIDEFQDTSSLQWKGMLPLLLEILQHVNGLVLIVGDPKQSIYRWRGGRMELIIDGIAPDLAYHWEDRKDISLKENYRSAKEIVEFNNAFFLKIKNEIHLTNTLFKNLLIDVEQQIIKTDKKGFVQCKWLEKSDEEDVQLQETLKIIQSLETTKKYSDIAVLTRNNMHGAAVANYLQEHQIPVVSTESLLLQNQLSVKLLIAALEYVIHSKEDFYAVKLNYLYAQYLQQENIESYLCKQKTGFYFFEQEMKLLQKNNIEQLSSIAANELVFMLMNALTLDRQTDNYILRFQDIIYKFVQNYSSSPREFLDYWNEQKHKLSVIPPEGMDAVKIYTIHKSKGLQFPVVIVPYVNWSMKPKHDSSIWVRCNEPPFNQLNVFPAEMTKKMENSLFEEDFHKELELNYIDNINLLYVAFTRAEEQLYILSNAEKITKEEVLPQNVSRLLSFIIPQLSLQNTINEINEFSFGEKTNTVSNEEETVNVIALKTNEYGDFKIKLPLVTKNEYNEAQVKGNNLHEVLSKIYQPNQLSKAILTTILTEQEKLLYSDISKNIIELFEKNNWFDKKWQHLNERNLLRNDKLLKADKILLSKDDCIVIDYKTGAKEKAHIIQLQEYMSVCRSILKQKIQGYLLYVNNMELIEIHLT
jgi:ATP-dependent exoDNAse (exonuclease V) beta subunit